MDEPRQSARGRIVTQQQRSDGPAWWTVRRLGNRVPTFAQPFEEPMKKVESYYKLNVLDKILDAFFYSNLNDEGYAKGMDEALTRASFGATA